ncbi:MAG: glutamine synthetase [Acidobacteriia bacterium]|nr:glutamine synthetase [Terriglobia bacterium]
MTLSDVLKRLDDADITRVKIGAFDIDGVLRGKHISRKKFESSVVGGLGFCDVIFGWDIADTLYDGVDVKVTGWNTGYPDAIARIDLDSCRLIPWEPGTALLLLDLCDKDGSPLPMAPRNLLRSVVAKAEALGYDPRFAAEYEFFIYRETPQSLREKGFRNLTPLSPGMFGYSVLRASAHSPLVLDIFDSMNAFNVPLEGLHTETGPGVYEAAVTVDKGLAAGDKAALFKTGVKEICARHQLIPTFMAKVSPDLPGCGGHIHQSLWDKAKDNNLFHGGDGVMSDLMQHYIAGLVKYLPELLVLFAPTINSYKRLVPGTWAPVNASWGMDNRTAAVRAIPGRAKSARIEMRMSGADNNPYLGMAACLAAGLDGIDNQLDLPEPVTNAYAPGNAAPLPGNLTEATARFRSSEMARRWFGDAFVDHYAATRDWEVRQHHKAVTDWELSRYFESI